MLCQHCNQNEATIRFQYNVNGQGGEIHLCAECAEKLQSQAGAFPQLSAGISPLLNMGLMNMGGMMDWSGLANMMRQPGTVTTQAPPEVDDSFKHRRRINELRTQLSGAVEREDYEEAARLRDEIKKTERGVCAHES